MPTRIDRRRFLATGTALGCSLAASPLLTPVSFASAPWDSRLVVIILRGGMDGLDIVRPVGDAGFAALGRGIEAAGAAEAAEAAERDLDGFFALNPALDGLMPMWRAGELGFVHAVSTPYRDKRSHFDGQDMLEAGTASLTGGQTRDGWLNRMLQAVPGLSGETAYAIGREEMLLLTGAAPVSEWSPDADLDLSPQARLLLDLVYSRDPAFRAAASEALALTETLGLADGAPPEPEGMQASMLAATRGGGHLRIARFAAERLTGAARVAAFSLNGWDTHRQQARTLRPAATRLAETLTELRDGLGPAWDKTAVIAMTEFGRTARLNGTGGTDHGTGGAMVLAGGALRGGRVHGDWPGLADSALYNGRDLMPTRDVRAYPAWVMHDLLGINKRAIEGAIFPGLEMGSNPGLVA